MTGPPNDDAVTRPRQPVGAASHGIAELPGGIGDLSGEREAALRGSPEGQRQRDHVLSALPEAAGSHGGRSVDEQAVLDAAEASLIAVGVRRTTLTDVARRAGVSRMTLYRRWPDLRSLVSDVMTREWTRVVTGAAPPGRQPHSTDAARAHLVGHVVATIEAFRVNRLFRKIVETDPELLLPYVLDRRGATQQLIVDLLETELAQAQAAGHVRAGDTAAQARMLLLTAQSFVLSAAALGADVADETLSGELRRLLEAYLAPEAETEADSGHPEDP